MKSKLLTTLFLSSAIFAQPLLAKDNKQVDHRGVYVGGGYGLISASGDDDFDDDDDAYNVFIGTQFNQMISLEAGYLDFGKFGNDTFNTKLDGYTLGLKLGLPVTERITLFVKGGNYWWDADLSGFDNTLSLDGNELFYGAGASFAISKNWQLNLDYTRYDFEFEDDEIGIFSNVDKFNGEVDYASLSVQYTF